MRGYRDRVHAGEVLAGRSEMDPDSVVCGLPRGGIPVAAEVCRHTGAKLSALLVRKVGIPWQPELAMGAVAEGGLYLDEALIRSLEVTEEAVMAVVASERAELERRREALGIPAPDLGGRDVLLVDDGLATGSSMIAAVRVVKAQHPAHLRVAVPVGSSTGIAAVAAEGVEVDCPLVPHGFRAVGEWYQDFAEVSDEQVRSLLSQA